MRIQILHLPAPADEYPFALVIDEAPEVDDASANGLLGIKDELGARAVLVFRQTVEVA